MVSDKFGGLPLLKQHQLVNTILANELATHIHALAIKTMTPEKWREMEGKAAFNTPNCLGGSKHDPTMRSKTES